MASTYWRSNASATAKLGQGRGQVLDDVAGDCVGRGQVVNVVEGVVLQPGDVQVGLVTGDDFGVAEGPGSARPPAVARGAGRAA